MTNHFRFDASPRATMQVPLLGEVRLREVVPGVGGILGCRVSERRGRWFASFQFDTDWNDGERSDKAELIARAKARKDAAAAEGGGGAGPDGRGQSAPDPADDTGPVRSRPERMPPRHPRHPRPGTVVAVDVGIVDAAVVSTGGGMPARYAGQRRSRPDRHAAARRLIAQRQRRLARSVERAKLAAAIASRAGAGHGQAPNRPGRHRRSQLSIAWLPPQVSVGGALQR